MSFEHVPNYEADRDAAYQRVMQRHLAEAPPSHRRPTDKELYEEIGVSKKTFYRWEQKRLSALPPDIAPPPPSPSSGESEEVRRSA